MQLVAAFWSPHSLKASLQIAPCKSDFDPPCLTTLKGAFCLQLFNFKINVIIKYLGMTSVFVIVLKHGDDWTSTTVKFEQDRESKFLGIIFYRKRFSLLPLIKYIKNKCLKALNLLKILAHASRGAYRATLLRLYRSLVRSK